MKQNLSKKCTEDHYKNKQQYVLKNKKSYREYMLQKY